MDLQGPSGFAFDSVFHVGVALFSLPLRGKGDRLKTVDEEKVYGKLTNI